ncbi:MAG TPA: flagellar basal body P-ring formation chaperone FlgA [Nevskiaceae bacterium]|nr:flagellar basal body P-ring formation chaperone FlgA [Nevskiaceae bacterium]
MQTIRMLPVAACALASCVALGALPSGNVVVAAKRFLTQAAAGQGGVVTVKVLPGAAVLPPCADPQPFMPRGEHRLLGTVSVGVRCSSGTTRYLQADIAVSGSYWVAAEAIPVGTRVTRGMLKTARGNLAKLPPGAVLVPSEAVGRVTTTSLASGAMLLKTELRAPTWVHANAEVAVVATGPDFEIMRHGTALQSGPSGSTVSVRFPGGRIVQGTVVGHGRVSVSAGSAQASGPYGR